MLINLYRAVSQEELNDIIETGTFRTIPESLAAKQFGRSFDEVKHLANFFPETVAIVRISISESLLNRFDLTPVDQPILKSGTVTAHEGEQLDLLNHSFIGNIDPVWSK